MDITTNLYWQKLIAHKQRLAKITLNDLFAAEPQRFQHFSLTTTDLLYDFSKQKLDLDVLQDLMHLANDCELASHIQDLFAGKNINITEDRPALHMQLRKLTPSLAIKEVRQRIISFVSAIHAKKYLGITDKPIKHVISLGIGGSDLGPYMACEALKNFAVSSLKIHFIANVDGESLASLLDTLSPAETICIVNSKTFTTLETLLNAKTIKSWFIKYLGEEAILQQMFAVTANLQRAKDFGITEGNIFTFWDWVGGRYSVWSAVGLPLELMIGSAQFQEFLAGANSIDEHFSNSDFANNVPVLMALIGIWNINFLNYHSLLIMPYLDGLRNLPAYLQQLEMESNGKMAINSGGYANYMTAPVIWGGVGCNGQHAYMQLLHQGPNTIPIDFIAAINSHSKLQEQQNLLLASCISQSKALMEGVAEEDLLATNEINFAQAKMCSGNRPTSTILFKKLTPKVLGSLLAMYEHKVFVQGIVWQIQSFDQWGVELGKKITSNILPLLEKQANIDLLDSFTINSLDSSTRGLLEYIKNHKVD